MNGLPNVESDIGALRPAACTYQHSPDARMCEHGRPWSEVRAELVARKRGDYEWRRGRLPLYVYHDDDDLLHVAREAYEIYFSENALGGRAFPSLVQMEAELVQMSLALFSAPETADGSFTSGGTESIFLALKTARDVSRVGDVVVRRPKIVIPRTAHPAFDKAAHYLGVEVIRIEATVDLRVDVSAMEREIDDRTVMIAASAPSYPYGVYDPIEKLGEIAKARELWFHVDACLGGFLAPFARDEGYDIPAFDFSVPGVTSISADLHKYGLCAKGASVLLYQCAHMKDHQRFTFYNWPRGTYSTDTFLGSRPGGSVASAWAVAQYLGREGYRRLARKTMEAKQQLMHGIEEIPGLEVVRPTELSILLYRSVDRKVDIDAVAENLGAKGWFIGRTREPRAIHFALNAVHAPIVSEYLADLRTASEQARMSGKVGKYDDRTY